MTRAELIVEGVARLRDVGLDTPQLDTELLLAYALRTSREQLLAFGERRVSDFAFKKFDGLLERRVKREPIAYLLGTKLFFGLDFSVNRDVLIPRPESELLVEEVLRRVPHDATLTIADIGTGSGCLSVVLAKHLPNARFIATDISEKALCVARANAKQHRVARGIAFRHGNLLAPLRKVHLDVIVANLPYVPNEELLQNPDLTHEPVIALRGAQVPEKTYRTFLDQWYAREQRPVVFFEIHPNLRKFLEQENNKVGISVTFKKDLAGKDRLAVIRQNILIQ